MEKKIRKLPEEEAALINEKLKEVLDTILDVVEREAVPGASGERVGFMFLTLAVKAASALLAKAVDVGLDIAEEREGKE